MDPKKNSKVRRIGSSHFKKCTKKLQQESKSSKNGSRESTEDNFNRTFVTGTALDNHLILKEIFGYLSPADLKSCCEVNEFWGSVADPMIFDYQIVWRSLKYVKVRTTNGYKNPKIQERSSSIAAEMKYLRNLKRGIFIDMTIDFSVDTVNLSENEGSREFVTSFGSMVYKLTQTGVRHTSYGGLLFPVEENVKVYCNDFPNVEDLRLVGGNWRDFVGPVASGYGSLEIEVPMFHVRKFYFGRSHYYNARNRRDSGIFTYLSASNLLKLVPNVQEIHVVPFTMLKEFRSMNKLHLLRSVTFNRNDNKMSLADGMKCLVESKLKFQSVVIGRKLYTCMDSRFIERNKQSFEALLELGKNTLEHVIMWPLKYDEEVNFPTEMPAVKHITFRGRCVEECLYFHKGEVLSKIFPNLVKITFLSSSKRMWSAFETLWLPGGIFHSAKACQRIEVKLLGVVPESSVMKVLTTTFASVECVELVKQTSQDKDAFKNNDGIIFCI
ncbi:unnamed protein product [Allacma fusca]|uniref:F-box domain-containing protein n=1 Tax=Allacma fusca TaxID=39272 RepID=A0A8J2IY24_9HEXA|nr:unnamed protein product [Allacma fusca]